MTDRQTIVCSNRPQQSLIIVTMICGGKTPIADIETNSHIHNKSTGLHSRANLSTSDGIYSFQLNTNQKKRTEEASSDEGL